MSWEERLKQDLSKYCQLNGIKIVRGKVSKQYEEQVKNFCFHMKRTYKNEYRHKKKIVEAIGATRTLRGMINGRRSNG